MDCPSCGGETKVVDSRVTHVNKVRRRRRCLVCNGRFTTFEEIELDPRKGHTTRAERAAMALIRKRAARKIRSETQEEI